MHLSAVVLLTTLAVLYSITSSANASPLMDINFVCKKCLTTRECDEDPKQLCIWGEARDACGRRICAKGPGERCGGEYDILGVCGEGMMCKSDEVCHGCSMQTMQCWN